MPKDIHNTNKTELTKEEFISLLKASFDAGYTLRAKQENPYNPIIGYCDFDSWFAIMIKDLKSNIDNKFNNNNTK